MAVLSRRATFVGALWNVAAMVFPLLSTLLLSVVISRRLGPAELGQQSVIAYVGSVVSGLVVIAATNCATQVIAAANGAGEAGRSEALGRLSARVHLVGGGLAAAGLAAVGPLRNHALAWLLIGVVTLLDAIGWSHASRLVALQGWRSVSPLRLVSQFAGALLGVLAVLLGSGLAGVFAAQAVSSAWLTYTLRRRERRSRTGAPATPAQLDIRPLARLWLMFVLTAALVQVVDRRVELLFLDAYRTPHEVALYAVAFSLIAVAATVPGSLADAATPGIAAAQAAAPGSLHRHLRHATTLAVLGGCLLAAAVAAVGPPTVLAFWGQDLRGAAEILPWMAASVLFMPLTSMLHAFWIGVARMTPVLATLGAAAVLDLGTATALVPSLGTAGAVAANVLAQMAACLLMVGYTRRALGTVLPRVVDILRCLCTGGAAGVAAWSISTAVAPTGALLAVLAGGLAFLSVVAAIGLAVGLLPCADADWLAGTVPSPARPALIFVGGLRWHGQRSSRPLATDGEDGRGPGSTAADSTDIPAPSGAV